MKIILSIFLFLLSCLTKVQAQEININTTRFVGGDASCGGSEAEYSIATKDGGILFVGSTTCYNGGGDIPPNFADTTDPGAGNVLIGKLDSNMNVSWVKVYGGTDIDIGKSAVQTPDGGYAVLAYTISDDIDVSGNHSMAGAGDYWLIRLDSLGNLLWQQCYGSTYDEQPGSIALTPDNGFIMLGVSNGSGDEVPFHYGTDFNENWFIVKTDSNGNMQWGKTIGGSGNGTDGGEFSNGSIFYADSGYYFVSSTNSTDHDCTDTAWHPGVNTGYDYYIFKLDTAGNILWDSSYGGGGGEGATQAIWDSRDSSIVINGLTNSNGYMVSGYNGGANDMWVVKTDKNGVLKWEKCLGGNQDDEGYSISVTNAGYMAYGSTNIGTIGQQDAWLFALDNSGNEITNKQFGGTGYEWIYPGLFPFKNGYVATGFSNSDSFANCVNIGHPPELIADVFITYLNFWPLSVPNTSVNSKQINIYPNPANEMITVLIPNEGGNLIILNYIGENIYSKHNEQNKSIDINTVGWASGIYIAKWQHEDGTVLTTKFIKN